LWDLGSSGKLRVRAPLATGVAHESGCDDGYNRDVVEDNQGDASDLMGSDEITCKKMESIGTIGESKLGRYEVYVVSPQLREGLGLALIDTGAMVSLVRESSVIRFKQLRKQIKISGITGKQINVRGQVDLRIENSSEPINQKCYIVDSLPRELDVILGQDWLEKSNYGLQKKNPIIIPPYSEQIIKCETHEKGIRFIEHQLLQPGLMAASSLVDCRTNQFPCLVINLTDKPISMLTEPKLEKPPTMIRNREWKECPKVNDAKRLQLLRERLRLNHITEGADDINRINVDF
jgi:hypothetical protein